MSNQSLSSARLSERLADGYLVLMLSVFLVYTGPGGYVTITEDKFRLFTLLTGLYAALSLLLPLELWLIARRAPAPRRFAKLFSFPQWMMLLYLLWTALATLCSISPSASLWGGPRREGLVSIALYCAAFVFVSLYGRPKPLHLWLFAAGISVCCLISVVQLLGHNPLNLFPEGMNYYDRHTGYAGEFLGTVGNAGLLAAVLCVAVPVFWVALVRLPSRRKYLLLVPLLLSLTVLCLSRIEAGLVGVFGGALLTIPVVVPGDGRRRKKLALCCGGCIVLAVAGVYWFGGHMPGFLFELHRLLHGHWDDTFGSSRLYIWRNVLPLVGQNPLVGLGPDTLGIGGEIYFERYHEQLDILLRSVADTAHNEYLNVAVHQGLPALLFYLGGLLCAALYWVKRSAENTAVAICGAGVLGYCVQAFFGLSSIVSAPYFWIALALLAAEIRSPISVSNPTTKRRRTQ